MIFQVSKKAIENCKKLKIFIPLKPQKFLPEW